MRRLLSITAATAALYIVTHVMVLLLVPAAFLIAIFGNRSTINGFKKFFASAVFAVIGKEVSVVDFDKIRRDE